MDSSVNIFKQQVLKELKTNITKELFLNIQNAKDKDEIIKILFDYEQHLKDIQKYKKINVLYYTKNVYTKILLEILKKTFLFSIKVYDGEYPLFRIRTDKIKVLWDNNMKYLLPNICSDSSSSDYYSYFHIEKEDILIPGDVENYIYDYTNIYMFKPINKGE